MEKKRKPRGRRQCRIVARPSAQINDELRALAITIPRPTPPTLEEMQAAMVDIAVGVKENAAG